MSCCSLETSPTTARVEEAQGLTRELRTNLGVPTLAVLGNHDFEGGAADAIRATLREGGITVLDGDSCEVKGVGFAGVKGFCGGFGRGALGPWGEDVVKGFVNEAVQEALKLESALARLRTPARIVLLHYAPIVDTVVGEPPEIFPWMGSSRLEEPLGRLGVTAIFHGHAHKGQAEGRTASGTPVYNVSLPLMARLTPECPIRILEVDMDAPVRSERQAIADIQAAPVRLPRESSVSAGGRVAAAVIVPTGARRNPEGARNRPRRSGDSSPGCRDRVGVRCSPTAGDDAFVAGLTGIVPTKRVCLPPCDASSAKPKAVETQMSEAPTAATASVVARRVRRGAENGGAGRGCAV